MRIVLKDFSYDGKQYKEVSFDCTDYDVRYFRDDLAERIFDMIHDDNDILDNAVVIEK